MYEAVVVSGHIVARAKPPEALVAKLENTVDGTEPLGSGSGGVDGLNELGLPEADVFDLKLGSLCA